MVKVSYQVIFKGEDFNKRDFREVLISILKEIFEGEYNELVEYVSWEDIIKINYCHKINEDKYIIGFDVDFNISIPENPENSNIGNMDEYIKKIIEYFNESLLDNRDIETAFKFYDGDLLNQLEELYKEIFEVEMKLREVLTFIFATILNFQSYDLSILGKDCYDFLKHQEITPNGIPTKKENARNERFKSYLENEFFYLTFGQYISLKIPNFVEIDNLLEIIKFNENKEENMGLDEILNEINNIPIIKYREMHNEFLKNIYKYLDNIANIRNCVAHNRTITDEKLNSYRETIHKLKEELDSFFKPKVIFATIYVDEKIEHDTRSYRQNSTTLELRIFGEDEGEEIDFGDEIIYGDSLDEKVKDEFKELLLKYLNENNYDISCLDKSNIEIERI